MSKIEVVKCFSNTPGARLRSQGDYSGEEFRETILDPAYRKAKLEHDHITVILDGAYGYPPSFLEESFGGLARQYPKDNVASYFSFVSNDEPTLIGDIYSYISHGNDDARRR